MFFFFFFSSRRRHTRFDCDWSSDVCSSDLTTARPDDLYRKRYLKEAVDQCVGQLPAHHRVVFVLRELEGKSYAEIADITGCNLGTVKSRLNRARNSFAQLIEPLLE